MAASSHPTFSALAPSSPWRSRHGHTGLVKEGQDPQRVAADQLIKDGVEILHTIGGDDTNIAAADLAAFLARENYNLCVIGLPKTIDNDVFPITQSLGAWTAAEEGAVFFENVGAEATANPRMMIVHEVMGRDCGWLTAATVTTKPSPTRAHHHCSPCMEHPSHRPPTHPSSLPCLPACLDVRTPNPCHIRPPSTASGYPSGRWCRASV